MPPLSASGQMSGEARTLVKLGRVSIILQRLQTFPTSC
jgi:hypothetical protein